MHMSKHFSIGSNTGHRTSWHRKNLFSYRSCCRFIKKTSSRTTDTIATRCRAGERLGFLPGDMKEKIDPYLRPLYDALFDMMPSENVERMIENGQIEIAPLAFMRGRTLANSFVILDEAQNTTSPNEDVSYPDG